jgi:hypothetical protein
MSVVGAQKGGTGTLYSGNRNDAGDTTEDAALAALNKEMPSRSSLKSGVKVTERKTREHPNSV